MGLALSPDGRSALSLAQPFSDARPQLLPIGAGEIRDLEIEGIAAQPGAIFLPDGSGLLIAGKRQDKGNQIFNVDIEGGAAQEVTPEGVGFHYRSGGVSPKGDALVAIGPDHRLTIYPLDGGESRVLESSRPGDIPVQWSDDGRFIYLYTKSSLPALVERLDIVTGEREPWMDLSPRDPAGVFNIDMLHITRDGKYYVFSFRRLLSDLYLIDGLG